MRAALSHSGFCGPEGPLSLPPSSDGVKGGQGQGLSLVSGRAQGCVRGGKRASRKIGERSVFCGCVKIQEYVCVGELQQFIF